MMPVPMSGHAGRLLAAASLGAMALVVLTSCGESATPTSASPEVITRGEEIFQRTAGGVGCASCHGADGRGLPGAPNIVGADVRDVETALDRVSAMRFIELDPQEVEAVAAYLQTLR